MAANADPTVDPGLTSWVRVPSRSPFPIQALPYGVFARNGGRPRVGVAIGDQILDLAVLADAGLLTLPGQLQVSMFDQARLDSFLAAGRSVWTAVRRRVSKLLSSSNTEILDGGLAARAVVPQDGSTLLQPFTVGDFVDFYSSLEHATNLGRMFRPDGDPLLPNWRHLPVGYHGRAGTVVGSGSLIPRPSGQRRGDGTPEFGPSTRVDFEVELGFVIGPGSKRGSPIPTDRAAEHIFGVVLVNDWSARDIQAWEYQPLGPFLGKSFATSIGHWVTPLDALGPYRVSPPPQVPEPLPYLRAGGAWGFDIDLEVLLSTEAMRRRGSAPKRISLTNFASMYWTMPQQLAHATINGASVRTGDLFASGTISGSDPGSYGSLIELTENGTQPIDLGGGETRTFLEDGDEISIVGRAGDGFRIPQIGLGSVSGRVTTTD